MLVMAKSFASLVQLNDDKSPQFFAKMQCKFYKAKLLFKIKKSLPHIFNSQCSKYFNYLPT